MIEIDRKIKTRGWKDCAVLRGKIFFSKEEVPSCLELEALGEIEWPLAYLLAIVVSGRNKRRGIGTALLEDFFSDARKTGAKMVFLNVSYFEETTLEQNIEWYKKRGFIAAQNSKPLFHTMYKIL